MPIALSSVLAIALALAAGPAAALGLGQLQVKSKPGQPLVAEIPIISSDPTELQGLQVQLAPPETFTRVGLDAPQGEVSSLRFEPALDAAGRPVIRVTSPEPVQAAALTFLLQVDWSQGRLVREYSALVDTPESIAATAPPPIQAPSVAQPNLVIRPAAPAIATQAPPQAAPPAAAVPTPAPRASAPPPPRPVAATPPASLPAAEPTQVGVAGQYGPVRAGQTLGQIAANLDSLRGYSTAQAMLALLRANPDAFIGGNVNLIKRGAVLKVPASDDVAAIGRSEAARLLHEQVAQWRAARPQPELVAGAAAASRGPAAPTAAVKSARTVGARLEIAPPSAVGRQRAGTQSGLEAGGEGEMLRQQLQETKETLAARDAEVNELKTRVAELEKLQQQQQQLLTMKDSALASAQQTLAKSNRAVSPPPAVASQSTPSTQPPAAPPQAGGLWLWGGLALIVAALLGWLMTRQRQRSTVLPKRIFDTEALAASIPVPQASADPAVASAFMPDQPVAPRPMQPPRRAAVIDPVTPPWHGDATTAPGAQEVATSTVGRQLEMAQSCLDRGDEDAARLLLREVLDGRDPVARETAARLLRDL
ncbi:FimV/HubP family polar landmark protein [Cognatiluteimonas profundi]|uniref:FimV/HubP family polar landmark protein n=1 Tax=Cognatiluteimonas profundi TaxID=2594501 RepID=UPI001E3E6501|nr:FimV/HubP family polar landmark protein [Lysobacter profundi]